MDTTDPRIRFDAAGLCNHCTDHLQRVARQLLPADQRQHALDALAERIKLEGHGKDYDCIIGVSGGVDSTTVAYTAKNLGLRPLAVHFDNGWNSELAVDNIKKTLDVLGIELYTYVVDWAEFKDLQLSFLKASVPNAEIPTDHGITATLFNTARKFGTRFILSGSNLATEGIMPLAWGHFNQDLRHLKAVHRRFGTVPLKTLPGISVPGYLRDVFMKKVRQIPFLNYIDYNKDEAKELLARELGWRDYGGKHYESIWTRFFQGYYLPVKFGFDKRKAHFSSLICSGAMTRDQALEALKQPIYDPALLAEDRAFVLKKLGLSEAQFQAILDAPPAKHTAYPSHAFLFETLAVFKNAFRTIATQP
jgi:N-acetyl sugar amidotransferase